VNGEKIKENFLELLEITNLAKEKEDVDVLCFNFKQNMSLPHLQTSDVVYM